MFGVEHDTEKRAKQIRIVRHSPGQSFARKAVIWDSEFHKHKLKTALSCCEKCDLTGKMHIKFTTYVNYVVTT